MHKWIQVTLVDLFSQRNQLFDSSQFTSITPFKLKWSKHLLSFRLIYSDKRLIKVVISSMIF